MRRSRKNSVTLIRPCLIIFALVGCQPSIEVGDQPVGAKSTEDDSNKPSTGTNTGNAEIACGFWASFDDDALLVAIHEELHSTYRPITPEEDEGGNLNRYTTARRIMFSEIERTETDGGRGIVECIYTGQEAYTPEDADPDRALMNCEHVVPRNRMVADRASVLFSHQESDIHNLSPALPNANSFRGQFRFGQVVYRPEDDFAPSVRGENRDGELVFQPREPRRGDVARMVFYFTARWGVDIQDLEEETLRGWAEDDPVDARERARNNAIHRVQGNRNPFIDCPDLIERIPNFQSFQARDQNTPLPDP